MKQIRVISDGRIERRDRKGVWQAVWCPLPNSSGGLQCGDWCAWYNEEEYAGERGQPGGVRVTCRGKTIGELEHES